MSKLTDTQLIVLSSAAASDDGAARVPARLTRAAAIKVGSSLVGRKLMREVRAKLGMPVWREDEDGRSLSLVLTRAGRDAIGVEDEAGDEAGSKTSHAPNSRNRNTMAPEGNRDGSKERTSGKSAKAAEDDGVVELLHRRLPREGSKQALLIAMLQKSKGASLQALIEATGWLPHTTRAALTGLRKRGFMIALSKETTGSVYRIVDSSKAAA